MIHSIMIQNIFPFEKLSINFTPGLNILTGESGTGKSALISAIGFLLGGNGDRKMIRPECTLGVVEGEFLSYDHPDIHELLKENEIHCDFASPLVIRRELFQTNKTRAFINDQVITLSLLQKMGALLMEMVSQHSHQDLLSPLAQREVIDLFGNLSELKSSFTKNYRNLLKIKKNIEELEAKKKQDEAKTEEYLHFQEEIRSAAIEKDEEEKLTQEHLFLSHAQEIKEKIDQLYYDMSDKPQSLVAQMEQVAKTLEEIKRKDPSQSETVELSNTISLEMQELVYLLRDYLGSIDPNPERLQQVEERLKLIEKIKKKHGKTFAELEEKIIFYDNFLENIANFEDTLISMRNEYSSLEIAVENEALALTRQRKAAAENFQKKITSELKTLCMPHALFQVSIEAKQRSDTGDDSIVFSFSANKGIKPSPLKGIASGGELSRLLLAMKTLIGQKEKNKPMLFDEIDANVGGTTAGIVGDKLKELGAMRQILCITHFVQVAKCGDSHYRLTKTEDVNGAKSTIARLLEKEKEEEYHRMIGILS